MTIAVVGAHPDDPESGCGGLACRAAALGHRVIFLYLTSGRPEGLGGSREQEARASCRLCGAEPVFFGYPDPGVPLDRQAADRLRALLDEQAADIVLAHWPVDTHPDHQAAGSLAIRATKHVPGRALAFYPVLVGRQTIGMAPNRYIDITGVTALKRQMVFCHQSQRPDDWYPVHEATDRYYGLVAGVEQAEGYYLWQSTPAAEEFFAALSHP